MKKATDLADKRFGDWSVKYRTESRIKNAVAWLCQCRCGTERTVYAGDLMQGKSTGCGCTRTKKTVARSFKHGHSRRGNQTGTYETWKHMLSRCLSEDNKDYAYYGGRGVAVCERWLNFKNFLADMGERPPRLTIDRYPNPAGNYEPGNCRWATRKQQRENRRA